jgi:hypothetical protein
MPNNLPKYATHLPLLQAAVETTGGPVLELGQGKFSTGYLRGACADRVYISAESSDEWFQQLDGETHKSVKIPDPKSWDKLYEELVDEHFSVVLIDHAPAGRRPVELEKLRDRADLFIIHDARADDYRYEPLFGTFKHRYTHSLRQPETTVVSNNTEAFAAFKERLCRVEGCAQGIKPIQVVLTTFCTPDLYVEDTREMLASVDKWQASFREHGVTVIPYVYPTPLQGSWKKNTFMKPTAILSAFDEYMRADGFLYLDADARLVNPLPIRWMLRFMHNQDKHVAAHILKRRSSIELLSGTMLFQNTGKARDILTRWRDEAETNPDVRGDQDILHKMLRIPKTKKFVPEFHDLPPEWTWIAAGKRLDISERLYGKRPYYIKHTQASRRIRKDVEAVERNAEPVEVEEVSNNPQAEDPPVVRTPGKELILVHRRVMYRPAQEKPLRDKIEASGYDYAFTSENNLHKWVKQNGKPAAVIRWDESAGVSGLRAQGIKLTKDCYELGIAPLYLDFGYFDHYSAYMIDWYTEDGYPSTTNGALWNSMKDDDSWRDDAFLQDYFAKIKAAYEKAANSDPVAEGDYILAFAQCTARRCRLPFRGNATKGWLEKLVEVVGADRLVVKQPPANAGVHDPEGVRTFRLRGENRPGPGVNPPETIFELNANLAYHASAIVSNTSSVSNEMLIMNMPMFMTGKSWFHGLGVFDEPATWEEIAARKPRLGPPHLTNRFAHWWISRREPYKEPNLLFGKIIEEWNEFGYSKPDFTESDPCKTRAHCRQCRTDSNFRESLERAFSLPDDFDTVCPHGVTEKNLPPAPEFKDSPVCESRMSCYMCRTNQQFRDNLKRAFTVPDDFDTVCPHGVTEDMIEKPEMPPLRDQAVNFAEAVGRTAKRLLTGKKVVASEEKRAERIEICRGCDLLKGLRCSKCGCNTVAKVALEGEKCPINKW